MRTVGAYLIYAAVVLRGVVIFADKPQLKWVVVLLALYGLLLPAERWIVRRRSLRLAQPASSGPSRSGAEEPTLAQAWLPLLYLLLQSGLVIGLWLIAPYEDFFATLFIPLSLQAVLFFGRSLGFLCIAGFSLAMAGPLLAAKKGGLFGLAMTLLYSSLCFLVGGYAHQVQRAERVHNQNQRMLGDLQVAHHQLQGYAAQVEELAAEQERNRLARELHDSVTQTVFSMNLTVQGARLLLERDKERVAGQLERLEELAASAMREIQVLVSQLRPRSVADEGLPAALRRLAAERQAHDGLQVTLIVDGERELPEPVAIGLYRIAQEALNNVAKHSGTRQATVRLNLLEGASALEIEDHGLGFAPHAALSQRGHLGLAGMTERAREMGWRLSIDSSPGHGTRIRVVENPLGGGE